MTTKLATHRTLLSPHRVYASVAVLAVALVTLLLPVLSARIVVGILGGIAALLALVSLGALVQLVVTDSWPDLRATFRRVARRDPGAGQRHAPTASLPGPTPPPDRPRRVPVTTDRRAAVSRRAVPASGGWHSALVDDALDDSFPASDPPSWAAMWSGPPAASAGRDHRRP